MAGRATFVPPQARFVHARPVRCGFEMMRDRGSLLRSRVAAYDVINVDVTNVDVTNVDVTNVDVTNVESHRRRLPRSFSDFLLDGPLQVRCPGVPDVYHHCVIGAKGASAHFAISLRRNFRASRRRPCAYLRGVILRHDGRV
jgi:hypothetical protein